MTGELFISISREINEVLTAATVIVAVSMLLYNLTHGPRDRVAWASSVLLACVSAIYLGDVFVALSRDAATIEGWSRFQWIGLAFAPAALFHLSDALLATTGLISRGRRRRVTRILYAFGVLFTLMAWVSDFIVRDLLLQPLEMMQAGSLFPLYIVYYLLSALFAFNNVLRARRRCFTRATHRRMSYLLVALIAPMAGIFPYSLLFNRPSIDSAPVMWSLINIGNIGVILMLVFMAYPLAFFGPKKPERIIKAELLNFMLRGPVTGIAVLVVILFVPRVVLFGIPGSAVMPFFAVASVMGLQWFYTIAIPFLERRLIYTADQDQARQIQELSQHLLTQADGKQLLEATLAAVCDYLRVSSAFVVSINGEARIEQVVGSLQPPADQITVPTFTSLFPSKNGQSEIDGGRQNTELVAWQSFWLVPLRSGRQMQRGRLIGVMGIWARSPEPNLQAEETAVFTILYQRAARVLDDMRFQADLFARVEDIIEESSVAGLESSTMRYGNAEEAARLSKVSESVNHPLPTENDEFTELIWSALRDYWGGPRLTDPRLLKLHQVELALAENENNPVKTVRVVLTKAIEALKPEGPRSMTAREWTLYNILDLRYVQGKKVRDTARSLALGDADFYRKQRIAVESVAQMILEREHQLQTSQPSSV
ncbi:MAG: histidine kinase N-terminal 7TM domain-containing protein [Anaerolineae bacterium]